MTQERVHAIFARYHVSSLSERITAQGLRVGGIN
jgi:hypothetical protein